MLTASALRTLYVGDPVGHLGVLVACEGGAGAVRGLRVRVSGSALASGAVALTRARARPWSARLAPWEQAGWEHALEPVAGESGALACVLRSARVAAPRESVRARAGAARDELGHAVWVELQGYAAREGRGAIALEVTRGDGAGEPSAVTAHFAVSVRPARPREVLSAYVAWEGGAVARAEVVRATLDALARAVAALPRGPRVVVARGAARERLYLRPGCAVLGARGLVGDARFGDLARRLRAGALELLTLAPPGAVPGRDAVLALEVACGARFARAGDVAVELALSVGRALAPGEGGHAAALREALGEAVRAAAPWHAFVAEHDYTASLLACTPWERAAGRAPARTLRAIRDAGGRIAAGDPGALLVVPAPG